jgi:hypothetical protein
MLFGVEELSIDFRPGEEELSIFGSQMLSAITYWLHCSIKEE